MLNMSFLRYYTSHRVEVCLVFSPRNLNKFSIFPYFIPFSRLSFISLILHTVEIHQSVNRAMPMFNMKSNVRRSTTDQVI